jgi:phospholipid/cholesterol/gamma-HCH transport system substrate-binding protein
VRSFRTGVHPLRAGVIALVLIAIGTYFAFTKDLPFTEGYRIQAVFENSNLVQQRSPVRIAGVDVGEVVAVERYRDTRLALVTMEIDESGRPIHRDATIKIRPRLFLEGNFYLDLEPGRPRSGEVADGGMIPVGQTSRPVQLDQVLTALQSDTRRSLQETVRGLGAALGSEPTPQDDADQPPEVHGLTGGEALNRSLAHGPEALRDSAIVNDALRGRAPRDLSRTIEGIARASRALAADERALADLVGDFDTTMATMAARAPELEETVRLLGPTAASARRGLASVGRALPPSRAFAREILPGLRETPATLAAAFPWLDQATELFGPRELGGFLGEMTPATRDLAGLTRASRELLPDVERFNRCVLEVLIPTGNVAVEDGAHSAGVESYKEFWYAMVGQAGEGQGFDGNGPFLRLAAPGGVHAIETGRTNYTGISVFGNYANPPLETRPAFAGTVPPLRRDRPCHRNPVPDVNGPASRGPADGSAPNAAPSPVPPLSSLPASPSRLRPVASVLEGASR